MASKANSNVLRILSASIVLLVLFGSIAFAADQNQDINRTPTNANPPHVIACTPEGQTMPVYPGYQCCSGLIAIPNTKVWVVTPPTVTSPTITTNGSTTTVTPGTVTNAGFTKCENLVGASVCSKCGNNTCEPWENYCNCPKDCPAPTNSNTQNDSNSINDSNSSATTTTPACACTLDYNPVCGANGKTYSNKCSALCEGITALFDGECGSMCGGIAGIQCAQGDECVLTNPVNMTDPVGYCRKLNPAYTCPAYAIPTCFDGKITFVTAASGCKYPLCTPNNAPRMPKYRYATWTCSDGTVHNEGGPKSCKTEATWKEYAARSCGETCRSDDAVKEQVKCVFSNTTDSQKCYSDDGKFGCVTPSCFVAISSTGATDNNGTTTISCPSETACVADVYGGKGDTITWKSTCGGYAYTTLDGTNGYAKFDCSAIIPQATSSTSGGTSSATGQFPAMIAAQPTTQNPNQISQTQPVLPTYNSSTCTQGTVTDFSVSEECSNTGHNCSVQAYEDIKALKDKCYNSNGKVIVTNDNSGCPQYTCAQSTSTSCIKKEDIPEEKYASCNDMNGQFYVKTDENGCVNFADCVGATTQITPIKVPDKLTLLGLALKLEDLKIEFDKLIDKVSALADYYSTKGDTNSADKFTRAVTVLQNAKLKIDDIKNFIKANIDSFDETKAQQVKDDVSALKENMLSEVLMILLE